MRIAGPIVLLVCGILALVGLFLAWHSVSILGYTVSISGWDLRWEWQPTLVLIGSILLLVCGIPALVLGAVRKAWGVVLGMGITSVLAAIMVIAGPVYTLIDIAGGDFTDISMVGAGVYICIVAGVIAFIFGILTAAVR
jgi:hypothetical protein